MCNKIKGNVNCNSPYGAKPCLYLQYIVLYVCFIDEINLLININCNLA